jgi:Heterokaryon incompatibility protein (HET)
MESGEASPSLSVKDRARSFESRNNAVSPILGTKSNDQGRQSLATPTQSKRNAPSESIQTIRDLSLDDNGQRDLGTVQQEPRSLISSRFAHFPLIKSKSSYAVVEGPIIEEEFEPIIMVDRESNLTPDQATSPWDNSPSKTRQQLEVNWANGNSTDRDDGGILGIDLPKAVSRSTSDTAVERRSTSPFKDFSLTMGKLDPSTTLKSGFEDVKLGLIKAGAGAGQGLVKVGKEAQVGIVKASKDAQEGLAKGKENAQELLTKSGIPQGFGNVADDLVDAQKKLLGKQDLCSKCKSLPLELCFPATSPMLTSKDVSTRELVLSNDKQTVSWSTPLSRIIYHWDWCRMCQLLMHMLFRTENDPLRDGEVAAFAPTELRGMSMHKWVSEGWAYTDKHWPFGHGSKRHEGATHVLGAVGEVAAMVTKATVKYSINRAGRARRAGNTTQTWTDVSERNKNRKTRFPISCILRVEVRSGINASLPGVLFADLIGYSNRPDSMPHYLSRFQLRAAALGNPMVFSPKAPLSYGRILDENWIDVSIGRHWLTDCETKHSAECSNHGWDVAMKKPGFLRVIDVKQNCIVEAPNPRSCRFVALSYVWGGAGTLKLESSNMNSLMQSGGLLKHWGKLPRTIKDAIEVVRQIGERHLWVDALCILQEKTEEALEQIATMDRVYGGALVTIVAADSPNADSGLPGVRRQALFNKTFDDILEKGTPRHVFQPRADMERGIQVIAPFNCGQDISPSVWSQRAWTFQEKILSKRLIIFSGNEITWYCRKMVCREDMPVVGSGYDPPHFDWLELKPQFFATNTDGHPRDGYIETTRYGTTNLVRSATFAEYCKLIEQYTCRKFTYDSDILRAFSGLSNIFRACFGSNLIYGLPEKLFDIALLWRPVQQLVPRSQPGSQDIFPSWSWAGWKGQIAYDAPLHIGRNSVGRIMSARPAATAESGLSTGEEGVRPLLWWYLWNSKVSKPTALNVTGRGIDLKDKDYPKEWEGSPYNPVQVPA